MARTLVFSEEIERDISDAVDALDAHLCSTQRSVISARFKAQSPPGHVDQIEAAAIDARQIVNRGIGLGNVDGFKPAEAAEQPSWLRRGVIETMVVWGRGWAMTCVHQPTTARPQPVFAVSWQPRTVVCGQCTAILAPSRAEMRHYPCDQCGASGLDLRLKVVQAAALMYTYAVCEPCGHVV